MEVQEDGSEEELDENDSMKMTHSNRVNDLPNLQLTFHKRLKQGVSHNKRIPCRTAMRRSCITRMRGPIQIPCRTAMRGSFPLNGTYFQVKEGIE